MFWKRISVADQTRVLVVRNGRFERILMPGDHLIFVSPLDRVTFETYHTRELVFSSAWANFLVQERPAVAEAHLLVIETSEAQVAIVLVDRKLWRVLPPGQRLILWRDAAAVTVELIEFRAKPEVPAAYLAALERLGRESGVVFAKVEESRAGLLYLDNVLVRVLGPGNYGFWQWAGHPRVDSVDLRRQTIEVPGQEILTRDKVSVRVNILAEYQVLDPAAAKQAFKDYSEQMYRSLQLAVRQTLGRKTLEEILADKTDVDATVAERVRAEMSAAGVRVGEIALKDVILPGDMRDIMNQLVSAEKQAQANVIRRREETAATRSLLNTAKLMEENPLLVRLKELETLETLVEKVDRVSV